MGWSLFSPSRCTVLPRPARRRLARARAVATAPVLPPVGAPPATQQQAPEQQQQQQQQPAGPPVFGPPTAPQIYASRFSARPRRPYNPLAAAGAPAAKAPAASAPTASGAAASGGIAGANTAGGVSGGAATGPPAREHPQQQAAAAAAAAANAWQQPGPSTDAGKRRQQQQQGALYGSYTAPQPAPRLIGFGPPADEPSGIDAIGSGGLGFRAPIAPRVRFLTGLAGDSTLRLFMTQEVTRNAVHAAGNRATCPLASQPGRLPQPPQESI